MRSELYEELLRGMVDVERTWTAPLGREGLGYAFRDVIHHLCHALAALDDLRVTESYETLDDGARVLAHEAFHSLVALAEEVRRAIDQRSAGPPALARARAAIDGLLDAFAPFVSGADHALRRCALDGVAFDLDALGTLDLGEDHAW
jgi:hypothetical protein